MSAAREQVSIAPGLYAEVSGTGSPVLLVHGFGDDLHTWDGLITDLESRHTVVRFDLPGHGRSINFGSTPADHERDVALELIDTMVTFCQSRSGRTQVNIVGHSLGGYLAMCHAVRRPETTNALGLIATGPGFRRTESRAKWNSMAAKATAAFGLAEYVAPLCQQHDALVLDGLDRLAMPVAQVVGSEDSHYFAGMEVLDSRLPDISTVRVDGGRHHVHQTHPAEVLAALAIARDRRP
ncbi:MAG: alpha/beta fold hydrolase [Acidimicrobiales bacterium]|jgi:pimeloyl-ACP methyl ester carboxylesterase